MAGYQTIEALRPILHKGPPATPVLDRLLFYKPRYANSPKLHQVQRMIEMRRQGDSTRKIAEALGFGRATVRRVTKDVAAPVGGWPSWSHPPRYSREKAARMHRAGFTYAEIAEDLGCHKATVHYLVTGYRRAAVRRPPSDFRKIARCILTTTGVGGNQLRRSSDSGPKVCVEVARARHIAWWVAARWLGRKQVDISAGYGGFNPKTVSRGIVEVDAVAEKLNIPVSAPIGTVVRMLWQAEWPKASV